MSHTIRRADQSKVSSRDEVFKYFSTTNNHDQSLSLDGSDDVTFSIGIPSSFEEIAFDHLVFFFFFLFVFLCLFNRLKKSDLFDSFRSFYCELLVVRPVIAQANIYKSRARSSPPSPVTTTITAITTFIVSKLRSS